MQRGRAFMLTVVLISGAFAETPEAELQSSIAAVRYAPLATMARVQGSVYLKLNAGKVTLLSGHPLLAPAAVDSVKAIALIRPQVDLNMTYHFVLVEPLWVPTRVTVNRGNALERAVLRLFRRETTKVVTTGYCQTAVPPPNELKISGATTEIWIFGAVHCLEVDSAQLLGQR